MDRLVATFVTLRRKVRSALPFAAVALFAALVVLHGMAPVDDVTFGAIAAGLAVVVAVRSWQRHTALEPSIWRDIELGLLIALAAYLAVVHLDGSLSGSFRPLIYVAIVIVSALARPAASLTVILLVLGFDAALREHVFGGFSLAEDGPHAGFVAAFALIPLLSLRIEIARLRRVSRTQLQVEREKIREEARSYRLLRAPRDLSREAGQPAARRQDEERLLRSGLEEIQLAVLFGLRLLRQGLGAYTAMLLWLDDDGAQLRISELVSDDPDLEEGPFSVRDGIIGAVLTQRAPVSVAGLKPSYVLPYYRDACPVRAVCAVPVNEHDAVRGVLVVDRRQDVPFGEVEQDLMEQAARFVARSIENERVFVQLERTKVEQGKLYRAAEALGAATTEQEVVEAGVQSAREIASVDFAAITSFDEAHKSHQVRAVSGERAAALLGRRFDHNTGLVSMALQNGHPLPYRGCYDSSQQVVFARGLQPPDMPSLVVLPLIVHDQPLGTLVLGSRAPGAFNNAARGLLEVLASHMAVSLSAARMVRRLEEQATTDGLTGLLNKRAMLDTAAQKLSAAKRFGRRLSVLIADIDHFKKVNDTYGHDVGDIVIKELAKIHQRAKRNTDAVARFGGEEFVVICEETDAEGGLLLAERIRAELKETTFHAQGQTIHCTCSVGIATFPEAGSTWDELFKAADEALYTSKRGGRDRATIWSRDSRHAA